ncbi:hypothetical protein [Mesorhizobium sp. SP-1A]|uniref:hypothetical protein n=1 Tax=Mesorhizobium sp. SP-1A TaxID=3077840 RepID=UPI0028F741FA|nr:hypothetical protein [Mesorhizobium sp. SP-1A]
MEAIATADLVRYVQQSLTHDLLTPKWRKIVGDSAALFKGHCYAASEAIYHILGGSENGWVPQIVNHARWPEGLGQGQTHWYLKNKNTGEIIDATAEQFSPLLVNYENATGCGFLTSAPSKRARIIMDRVKSLVIQNSGSIEN